MWTHKDAYIYYIYIYAISSEINGTPEGVYLPISKLHSISAVTNLLAHNNKSISYYVK